MCGVIGIVCQDDVAPSIRDGLIQLQHRGQDAAGIVTYHNQQFNMKHGLGLVREIFTPEKIAKLRGKIGIGHTRYPTAGGNQLCDIQPLYSEKTLGIAIAHNGNLTNYAELAPSISHLLSSIDSEIILQLIVQQLETIEWQSLSQQAYFLAFCQIVKTIMNQIQGSYSVVGLLEGKGLFAFRDPKGIRPLVLGQRQAADGKKDYIIASESTMFFTQGFTLVRDIAPGELILINSDGQLLSQILQESTFSPCIFEYVYFARPDSMMNETSVHRTRINMGSNLAKLWKKRHPGILPDVVIPVPFTSNTAALAFANGIGVPYSEGLYKNPFIGRTFIMPDGKKRSESVRQKLMPQKNEIEGKKVLLVDDSLVRGTTSIEIVNMLRELNAEEIYLVLACPPILHPCFYGINLPTHQELIASSLSEEEIRKQLDVNVLLYQEKDDLIDAISRNNPKLNTPCMACMNGCYPSFNKAELSL